MMTTERAWDYLIESGIASEQTLQIATSLDGYSLETLESVLFILTGERDFDDNEECDGEHDNTDELFDCESCSDLLDELA